MTYFIDNPFALSPEISISLARFVVAVTEATSEQHIYSTLAQSLHDIIPSERTSVTLLNEKGDALNIYSLHGTEGALPVGKALPLGNCYSAMAVEQQKGQLHHVTAEDCSFDGQLLYREGMKCILNAPIIVHGEPIGAVNTATTVVNGFDKHSLQLLQIITNLVSTNLERQLFIEERKKVLARYRSYAKKLESLHQLAQKLSHLKSVDEVLHEVGLTMSSLLSSQRISFALYLPEKARFEVSVLMGETIKGCQSVAQEGSGLGKMLCASGPVHYEFLSESTLADHILLSQQGLVSAWCIPIWIAGETVAVLNAASRQKIDSNEHLASILGTLGVILGNALERLKVQDKLIHQVNHDTITGLPNRRLLYKNIDQSLAGSKGGIVSVLFIDLDYFKVVNDTLGHQVGDELLCLVAKRIRHTIRDTDVLARVGGDEFIVLIPHSHSEKTSTETAHRIIESLSRPFDIGGETVVIGASIGISLSQMKAKNTEEMIKEADVAMYKAKAAGRNSYVVSIY